MLIDFLHVKIVERLVKLRIESGYNTITSLADEINHTMKYVSSDSFRRSIGLIEKGRLDPNNLSLLTESMIENYTNVFGLSPSEQIFGGDEDVELFCKYIFMNIFEVQINFQDYLTNIDKLYGRKRFSMFDIKELEEQYESYVQILSDVRKSALNLLKAHGKFSSAYANVQYDYYSNGKNLHEIEITDLDNSIFMESFNLIWCIINEEVIESFIDGVVKSSTSMYNLEDKIYHWIQNNLVILIEKLESKWQREELLKIGYEVYELKVQAFAFYEGDRPVRTFSELIPNYKKNKIQFYYDLQCANSQRINWLIELQSKFISNGD